MKRLQAALLIVLMVSAAGFARAAQHQELKNQVTQLERAIDDGLSQAVPGPLLQYAKGAYLEGYGVVVTIEVALERPRNPFTAPVPDAQLRLVSTERHESLKEKTVELLSEHVAGLEALLPGEKVSVVINVMNTNPAVVRDLPSQLVITATKQDAIELRSGVISASAFNERVTVRQYH
jgi:hypothetical protein